MHDALLWPFQVGLKELVKIGLLFLFIPPLFFCFWGSHFLWILVRMSHSSDSWHCCHQTISYCQQQTFVFDQVVLGHPSFSLLATNPTTITTSSEIYQIKYYLGLNCLGMHKLYRIPLAMIEIEWILARVMFSLNVIMNKVIIGSEQVIIMIMIMTINDKKLLIIMTFL